MLPHFWCNMKAEGAQPYTPFARRTFPGRAGRIGSNHRWEGTCNHQARWHTDHPGRHSVRNVAFEEAESRIDQSNRLWQTSILVPSVSHRIPRLPRLDRPPGPGQSAGQERPTQPSGLSRGLRPSQVEAFHFPAHTVGLQYLYRHDPALLGSPSASHCDALRASMLDCTALVRVCGC